MLLGRRDFLRAYLANAVSQLGDSFQFVAVLWLAAVTGGVFGVIAVRLADGLPALFLALAGGASADRRDRRRTMVACDLIRCAALAPVAVLGLAGRLSVWEVVPAGLLVASASSFFSPAFAASLPGLAGRENLQRANGLVSATNSALVLAGRALGAALLVVVSIGSFFVLNALSFAVSAVLLARIRLPAADGDARMLPDISLRDGFAALRRRPGLRAAIAMLALGTALMTGVWTVGVAELARTRYHHGAATLSLLLTATALGAISASALLVRRRIRLKVRTSCWLWTLLLPGFLLLGGAGSLGLALAGTFLVGMASGATLALVTTAAQESVPDELLGRVMGIVVVASVGAKPLGLLLIAPFYSVLDVRTMFVAGGVAATVAAIAATAAVVSETRSALSRQTPARPRA